MGELLYCTDPPMAYIPSHTYMLHIPTYWTPTSSALKHREPRPWDAVVHPQRKNHYERLLCCPCRLNTESFSIILPPVTFVPAFVPAFVRYPRRRTSVDVVYCQLTVKLCFITVFPTHSNTCTFAFASTHITWKWTFLGDCKMLNRDAFITEIFVKVRFVILFNRLAL